MSVPPPPDPAPVAGRRAGWLAEQLPRPLAEDPFLRRFLRIFEETGDTVRDRIDAIEYLLDPDLAPPDFVRMLGSWLGIAIDPALPEACQRRLVKAGGALLAWRGTRRGLQGLLEAMTASSVVVTDHGGVFGSGRAPSVDPRVEIRVADTGGIDAQHLLELVRAELPANAVVELRVDEQAVAGRREDDAEAPDEISQAAPEPLAGGGYLPPVTGDRTSSPGPGSTG